jgi:hypothetical protein
VTSFPFARPVLKDFFLSWLVVATAALPAHAQRQARSPVVLPRVFIECEHCDADHLQQTLRFVDLVRDRVGADVHVLVTSLPTGSGGRQYSVELTGRARSRPLSDTLAVTVEHDATQLELRDHLTRAIAVGLVPFVRDTPALARLVVGASEGGSAPASSTRDPWDRWVFKLSGSGNFDGDDNYANYGGTAAFRISRITEQLKLTVSTHGDYQRGRYDLSDGGAVKSVRRSWYVRTQLVHSASANLSFGLDASAESSIFENTASQLSLMPAVEFDLFPYRDATQRQLVLRYAVGGRAMRYVDTTVYGLTREARPTHEATIAADLRQRWGSLWGTAVWSQYLHDASKHRFGMQGGVDWRIVRGFTVNFGGGYSLIHDQLNLSGVNLTDEERLLRLRELASGSSFVFGFGLSYTFGSAFANAVNPRFRL